MLDIKIKTEIWPVAGEFRIARGAITQIKVVSVVIRAYNYVGRGECRPYARYGESPKSVSVQLKSAAKAIQNYSPINALAAIPNLLPAGAARNALSAALWDLCAKQEGLRIWQLLDIPRPRPMKTAFTLSIDQPQNMADAARGAQAYEILKLKIGGASDLPSIDAVIEARPDARLIIDANESLTKRDLGALRRAAYRDQILLIEQPLPAGHSGDVTHDPDNGPPICADESLHTAQDLDHLWAAGYRAVNIKLDKTGGIEEAVKTARAAKSMGFIIMLGCMVCTSLGLAPAAALGALADIHDLDGPLLLAKDKSRALAYEGQILHPPVKDIWG